MKRFKITTNRYGKFIIKQRYLSLFWINYIDIQFDNYFNCECYLEEHYDEGTYSIEYDRNW